MDSSILALMCFGIILYDGSRTADSKGTMSCRVRGVFTYLLIYLFIHSYVNTSIHPPPLASLWLGFSGIGFRSLAFGLQPLASTLWPPSYGLQLLTSSFWPPAFGLQPLAFSHWPSASGLQPVVSSFWILAFSVYQ